MMSNRGRILVVVLAAGLGLGAWFLHRAGVGWGTTRPSPIVPAGRAVAVLSLSNRSGAADVESAWLSTGLSEMLSTQLTAGDVISIPRDTIERMQDELDIGESSELSREALSRIRTNIGADIIIAGSFVASPAGAEGGAVSVDIRLFDAMSGDSLGAVRESGSEQELIDLARRAGARARETLGASGLSDDELRRLRSAMPAQTETLRLYSEGLARLRAFDALSAQSYLERAVTAEPSFVLAHIALSDALGFLGRQDESVAEARRAYELSGQLPHALRFVAKETYLERSGRWEEAVSVSRELVRQYPDSLDHGLSLSYVLAQSGRVEDAFRELDRLRRLPPPKCDDARIDMAEAWFSDEDPRRRLSAARRAAVKAESTGMRSMLGRALFAEGNARERRGQLVQAERCYERAGELRSASGDRTGLGHVLSSTSALLVERGELDEAVERASRSEEVFRELGDHRGLATGLRSKAAALIEKGRLADAARALLESQALFEGMGEASEAQRVRLLMASIATLRGDLVEARRLCQAALDAGSKTRTDDLVAGASMGLADVLAIGNRLAEAHSHGLRALDLRRRSGDTALAAKAATRLAGILLEDGQAEEALRLVRETTRQFEHDGRRDWEAEARATLALALASRGEREESRAEIMAAREIAKSSQNVRVRARVAVAAASLLPAPETRTALLEALAATGESGLRPLRLELQLAMIRPDPTGSSGFDAPRELEALRRDAERAGFLLIARRAAARR